MLKNRISKFAALLLAVSMTVVLATPAAAAEEAPLKTSFYSVWTSLQSRTGTLPAEETAPEHSENTSIQETMATPEVTQSQEDTSAKTISEFKSEVVRLVNEERKNAGLNTLTTMDILAEMADVRAKESAGSFSHTRPDGTRCFTIFAQYSLTYRSAGENLAFGFSTPEAVVEAWMNSPSHKANILSEKYTYIGIGYYLKDNGKIYCSQLFYTPQS